MSAQEFKVGQSISGTDYDRLPVGAKFRRGPQYSEYEVTETGFKLGMADTRLTAADYRSARKITHLPDVIEPEDKDDLYVETEPLTEPSVDNSEDLTEPEDADDVEPEPLKDGDAVLLWAKVANGGIQDSEDMFRVWLHPDGARFAQVVKVEPDMIVRPSAGQMPPWVKPARCTSLLMVDKTTNLRQCTRDGDDHDNHVAYGASWKDDEAYGRVVVSDGAS